jgi:hypothetical protein
MKLAPLGSQKTVSDLGTLRVVEAHSSPTVSQGPRAPFVSWESSPEVRGNIKELQRTCVTLPVISVSWSWFSEGIGSSSTRIQGPSAEPCERTHQSHIDACRPWSAGSAGGVRGSRVAAVWTAVTKRARPMPQDPEPRGPQITGVV